MTARAFDNSKTQKVVRTELKSALDETSRQDVGSATTYAELFQDKMMLVALIRNGISHSFFSLVRERAPFSDADWAELLGISTKTLQRYKDAGASFRFKPAQSERILEMAEVTNLGTEVLGDAEKFRLWLETPNYALGSLTPFELLKDSYGKELVVSELTRVHHGIFA